MANFYIDTITVAHELPNNDRPKFYMFGVPSYTNMGDQAVALAERKYIENEFPEYQYIEIIEEDDDEAIPVVKKIYSQRISLPSLVVVTWETYIIIMKKPEEKSSQPSPII